MGNYFLVVRRKKDNNFVVLDINEQWYLGDDAQDVFHRNNKLEAIDLVTLNFKSKEHLVERLVANKYIDEVDVDIFIASKRKKDGKSYVKFDEVVYSPATSRRINNLKTIASSSLNGSIFEEKSLLNVLYDDIISCVYSCNDLHNMITAGDTNIPEYFVEQIADVPYYSDLPTCYQLKNWYGARNYETVRNIFEALNRLSFLSASFRDDRFLKNLEFIDENLEGRLAIAPRLSVELDKNYDDKQISFYSMDNNNNNFVSASGDESCEDIEKGVLEKVSIPRKNISEEEKKREVFRVLKTLQKNTFVRTGEEYHVNYGAFKHPILDEEKAKLDLLLTGNMAKFFAKYAFYSSRLEKAFEGFAAPSEIDELQDSVEYYKSSIKRRFKSSRCISKTYDWCMLYEGCVKRDAAYEASGFTVSSGEENAKIFGKKQ